MLCFAFLLRESSARFLGRMHTRICTITSSPGPDPPPPWDLLPSSPTALHQIHHPLQQAQEENKGQRGVGGAGAGGGVQGGGSRGQRRSANAVLIGFGHCGRSYPPPGGVCGWQWAWLARVYKSSCGGGAHRRHQQSSVWCRWSLLRLVVCCVRRLR